ncbi:caspase family protein [Flammeovirga yaeyamensis]|uniref:Caspase family protein n=1 Tax=Flammeovirga yaeyamensis TaxID=367791 RepID=A0AAX1N9P6_9BACT|nr:caspase family protein [Flammeovirga yaeyamensis]MBB3699283.1 WD40 repeat protein [Flammeovirga yaeyamensis]NMF35454.1 hypothetical protein [Flammeovirga yaeyamensis]QWG04314.1 caspase family protein [Flammeovirga yaeyamensis]
MKSSIQLFLLFILSNYCFGQHLMIDPQGHSSLVRGVAFSNDNSKLVSVSEDKTIRIWDLRNNELEETLWGTYAKGKEGRYNTLSMHPKKNMIAAAGYLPNNEIRIIDLNNSSQTASFIGHTNVITDLSFSPDGQWLCSASADKTVKLWYVPYLKSTKTNFTLSIDEFQDLVYSVDFSKDGTKIVCASFDGSIKLYQLNATKDKATLLNTWETFEPVTKIKFSSNHIIAGTSKGKVFIYSPKGEEEAVIPSAKGYITTIDLPESEDECLIVDSKGNLTIYNTSNWLKNKFIPAEKGIISAARFANNTNKYVVYAKGVEGMLSIYDIEKEKNILQFESDGMSNKRIGRSEGKRFALSVNHKKRQPYNKVFDFEKLVMELNVEKQSEYEMPVIEGQGITLRKINAYTLQIGSSKVINDKNRDKAINAYCFTPKGNVIVSSGNSLKLYNQSAQLVKEFHGHSASVITAHVSKDGRYLISSSDDQTTKLWNIETGELLASLFVSLHNEWVCWSPKGYYHASAGGEKYIGWLESKGIGELSNYYSVNFADKRYHKKEVLIKIIEMGSFDQAINALGLKKVDPEELVKQQPRIEWVSPNLHTQLRGTDLVKVDATITSKSQLKTAKILVDGRPKSIDLNAVSEVSGLYSYQIKEEFKTHHDQMKVQIFAENEFAKITSKPRSISKINPENTLSDVGFDIEALMSSITKTQKSTQNIYLLSIGISNYNDKTLNLNYADKDALAISDIYRKQANGKLFNEVFVKELTNEEAKKENILSGFQWLSKNATSDDLAVVFIASHGLNWENNFYVIPHDVDLKDVDKSAVKWADCANVMTQLPSQVLLYVDACNSGQLGVNIAHSDNTESIRSLSSDENGVIIMSGSTGKESSLESSEWQHGAFTAAIIDGLGEGKADYSGDQIISLRELDLYIAMKVEELTKGKQHPTTQKPSTISVVNVGEMIPQ